MPDQHEQLLFVGKSRLELTNWSNKAERDGCPEKPRQNTGRQYWITECYEYVPVLLTNILLQTLPKIASDHTNLHKDNKKSYSLQNSMMRLIPALLPLCLPSSLLFTC